MQRKLLFFSLWIASLGAAFFAGKAFSPRPSALVGSGEARSYSRNPNSEISFTTTSDEVVNRSNSRARLEAAPMVRRGTSPVEMVADIAHSEDAVERNNALLALIDNLAPQDFLSVIDAFRALGITRDRMGEYEMLLTAWAKVNPLEALEYAKANTSGSFAKNTILATWAAASPDAAIAWAEANHEDKEAPNPWLVGVIEGLAPHDIRRATSLMETLPRSEERGQALNTLIAQLMLKDPEDAKSWSLGITDEYLRSGAYARIAQVLAEKNPSDAAKWLAEKGDLDALNRIGERVSEALYRQSPEEATNWVTSLPPAAMSEAAEGVLKNTVRENPIQAAEWLAQLASQNPKINFDGSIREVIDGSTRRDSELAATWVRGLSNSDEQVRYYHRVLGDWNNRDSEAARTWVASNQDELPDSIRRRFLRNAPRPQPVP